jgi:uncharacterized protein YbaA (DUF1428 family)
VRREPWARLGAACLLRSKAHRDAVNRRVMKNIEKAKADPDTTPFDLRRMGFRGGARRWRGRGDLPPLR